MTMIDPKEININGKQLSDILDLHKKWVLDQEGGQRAYLQGADLQGAYLQRANLQGADLRGAYLQGADLQRADLRGAYLQRAYLQGANLQGANLQGADLRGAYLQGADLQRAYLQGANLQGAKNIEWADAITRILPDGDIVGWKKCQEGIVKLLIPAAAKRSNATGRKCRAEYAVDQEHYTFDGKKTKKNFHSSHDGDFVYRVGQTIQPDSWDDNRWNECSNGVHFFITRLEAEKYEG